MIKFSVTTAGILIAAAHLIWPQIHIDAITVTLLAIAILPWLGQLFKTIELPGGLKVEYHELLKAEQTARDAGLLLSAPRSGGSTRRTYAFEAVAGDDSNLALAGLRIEIESRLRELANARNLRTDSVPIRHLLGELTGAGVLTPKESAAIHDLLPILNRAAHGAPVDERGKEWVLETGTRILDSLEDKRGELTMPDLLARWKRRDGGGVHEVGEELSRAFVTAPQAFLRAFRDDPDGFAVWLAGLDQNTFTIYQACSELDSHLWMAYYEKLKSLMLDASRKLRDSEFEVQAQQILSALDSVRVRRIW